MSRWARRASGVSTGSTKQSVRVIVPARSRSGAAMHQVKRSASADVSLKPCWRRPGDVSEEAGFRDHAAVGKAIVLLRHEGTNLLIAHVP